MSPDSIPQISLGTAAILIFALCTGFVVLRGLTRMIVGTLVLAASAWAGFEIWKMAPALSVQWTGASRPWLTTGLPVAAFLSSFLVLGKITNAIINPFRGKSGPSRPRSLSGTAVRLIFALFPTSLIWVIGAAIVHHSGAIAEIQNFSDHKNPATKDSGSAGFITRLKPAIESALPASWLARLDPLTQPSRVSLAKLIAAQSDPKFKPVIDPKTGKPIPRAIIVDDPELQNLAREGKFGTLLRHPLLTKALADPKIQKLLHDLDL